MPQSTRDLRIRRFRPLIPPTILLEELPLSEAGAATVKLLLEKGANPNAEDIDGERPLDWAIYRADRDKIAALEQFGAARGHGPRQKAFPPPEAGGIADPRVSVGRAVNLLLPAAPVSYQKRGCISCHSQALVAMAAAEARQKGIAINEEMEQTNLKQIEASYKIAGELAMQGDQPGGNIIDTVDRVYAALPQLRASVPSDIDINVAMDRTTTIRASLRDVERSLVISIGLVILVVFLFLQDWRATLIPFAAVPVSLIGTFAGLLLLGYSINTLTLFGMVLAIGIVVDDAIVVLENVERIMREDNARPREAAIKAMHEVTGPIVAIVLTLTAVFIPIAFLGGLTGELYRQFAVTISIAVVISGLVALTLTPALCALLLHPAAESQHHGVLARFFDWFNRMFAAFTRRYTASVATLIRRAVLVMVTFVLMLGVLYFMLMRTVYVEAVF
jgi:hypothetical protein